MSHLKGPLLLLLLRFLSVGSRRHVDVDLSSFLKQVSADRPHCDAADTQIILCFIWNDKILRATLKREAEYVLRYWCNVRMSFEMEAQVAQTQTIILVSIPLRKDT